MLALLSIIALAFATEYDVLYTENLYAEETDCVDERYWLCYFCQSNITYTVDATQEFQIKGLLQSDLELIYQIYDDLEKYVTGDEYTLALGNNKTCLAIGRISNDPDLTLMFQELMEVEYTSQDLAFVTDVPVMNRVLVNTQKGVSYDYYLEQLLVDFDSDSTATYLDSIKLDISQKRINLYQYYGYLEYLGDVEAGDASLAATFAVSVPYTSESLGIFEVTINVDAEYTLEEWTDNIAASYECSEIQSPKGLDYLQLLPVMFTVLRIDNTNNSLLNTIVYLGVPDFAITTGVELTILTGALYIADNECDVSFSGLWYTETGLELDIEFHAGKEENYKGQAYLANDPRQVNLLDLETLMRTLYFDSNPILPQYSLEGDLRNRLYTTIIHNPAFDIEFDTEMIVSLEGTGQIIDFEDSYIEIDFRRFETVIESFIYYTQVTNQALNVLHDFEWIENDGLFITNGQITSATTDTTLEDGTAVTPGILLEATLKLNTHCYDLEFCSLISKGLNISITTINSTYYPTDFYYEVPLRDLNMSSLQLYSNSYFLYFQPEKVQFIKNSFDIQGDYDSKLTFEGNITSVSGDAYLRSKLNAKWESVLNISTFAIPLLEISANINLKNVLNSTVQGRGQFEDTESTWPGDVLVSLNVNDYDNNFFIAVMYPTTPETFFKFLALRASLDPILQSFNFSAGANLEYSLRDYDYLSQGFYVYGSTKFLGLIAHFETRFLEITDSMTMKVSMPGFPCAFGNILVLPVNNTFNLALEIDPVSSSGNLTAMFALWNIRQEQQMAINDETFEFALTGHPFEGVYDAYLGVSAPINADITLATFTVSITINGLDVQRMENNILELLDTWVDLGLQVLKDSEEDLKVNEETLQEYQNYLCTDDCPKLVTCVTDFSKSCQKQLFYDCTTVGDVCSSPEYTCTDTETICLDETCESTVDACQFWEQTCEIYSSGGCDEFSVITIGSECLESIVSCETDEISDEECQKECEFNQLLYDDFEEYYESLVAENEETQTELKGFESLQGIKLAEIHSISSVVELNKSGVDTSDVTFTIEYSAYSLVEDKLVDLVATHKLNFYGEIKNDLKMFEIIKGYIIDNSDGSLSEELIRYSPLETSKNN